MKAWLCKQHAGPEALVIEEVADPEVTASGCLIEVKAAGLNFPDTLIIRGKYQFQPDLPFSPGAEVAGVVLAVGAEVKHVTPGDRVMAVVKWGGFAEKIVVTESALMPVPEGFELTQAAGFAMTYATSAHALIQRGRLQSGETLLVLGAGGGVGLSAVQIGKAMGAKVIAAASNEAKLELARRSGADELINYQQTNLKDTVKELTQGQGVDVVYDPVGGQLTELALRSMAWCGRLLVVGFATGDIPKLPANLTLLKGCEIVGVFLGAFTQRQPEDHLANFQRLMRWIQQGKIAPQAGRIYSFAEAATAIADMESRRLAGKAVVQISCN